ncbi:AMP-binding protein [Nonomuraea sp. NPDC049421]|uniref:AMP-binding protein n=1 Tax=Nonomuraea sp. NPDC049421 TaxID=3155275 RepID=UPI00344439B6
MAGGLAEAAAEQSTVTPRLISGTAYESMIETARELLVPVTDELSPLPINYTSGTTGRPKGVVHHHRGAYLQALAMALHTRLEAASSYLWTLPMFHCHGWCFPWAVTLAGARHVCLPKVVDPGEAWRATAPTCPPTPPPWARSRYAAPPSRSRTS